MNPAIGITIQHDCLIGAGDVFERWACENGFFPSLAWQGVLSEVLIVFLIILVVIIILLKRRK